MDATHLTPAHPTLNASDPVSETFDPHAGITGPITLPSGHTLTEEAALLVREAYALGHLVHRFSPTEHDQDAYEECRRRQVKVTVRARALISATFPNQDDRKAIATTFTGPDSWAPSHLRAPYTWQLEWSDLAATLQAGYLVHRYAAAATAGMGDPDAIWAYLALCEHPARLHEGTFYFFDDTAVYLRAAEQRHYA